MQITSWKYVSLALLSIAAGVSVWSSQSIAQEPNADATLPVDSSYTETAPDASNTLPANATTSPDTTATTDAVATTSPNAANTTDASNATDAAYATDADTATSSNAASSDGSEVAPTTSDTAVYLPKIQPSTADNLRRAINDYFADNPALAGCQYGAYIKVLDSERVLYSCHGSLPLAPASNMKIMTTATALNILGPDFRFTTEVWGRPVNDKGVICDDLYLRGNGDPTNTPPYWETGTSMYEKLADQLWDAGVREIMGDVVADDSTFDREYFPQGWADHYHLDSYSAPVAGLSINGNLVQVRVTGSGATTYPPNDYFKISYSASGAYDTAVERKRGSNEIIVRGPLSNVNRDITVDNPPMFAINAFAKVLEQRGIRLHGKVRLIRPLGEPATVTTKYCYAKIESPTLKEIITEINQQSDNFLAEHVFKLIGSRYAGQGNFSTGQAAVEHYMAQNGIDTTGLKMVDGCGLSELNRITPAQLVDTLVATGHGPYKQIFWDSLASNEHGTLRYRIPGADVHAKTGTLDHFTALSGYVPNALGQTVVFSLVFNKIEDISIGVDIQNKVVTMLAQSGEPL